MTIATLVKITGTKKLMMKISEQTFMTITARLTAECNKKNFPTERLATFSLENDDGDDCHFMMISLDKYDKQNMRKFEQLLKKEVAVQYRFKPYDFIPDGEDEQRCGINLELVSIRQIKPKQDEDAEEIAIEKKMVRDMLARMASDIEKHGHVTTETLADAEKMISDMPDHATYALKLVVFPIRARSEEQKPKAKWNADLKRFEFPATDSDSEIDEIADKAAARACCRLSACLPVALNAEEQSIDEDVEKQVAKRFPAPPVLERQNAATHRRRRVQPSEECLAAADYQMPEEIKAFAVIDAFEQEE